MPKRNNSKKNISSKNILKKMKDLSEYYKKKLIKGGDPDAAINAANNAAVIATEANRMAVEDNAAAIEKADAEKAIAAAAVQKADEEKARAEDALKKAAEEKAIADAAVKKASDDKAAADAAAADAAAASSGDKGFFAEIGKKLGITGGKSKKRRNNKRRKQSNKKRN